MQYIIVKNAQWLNKTTANINESALHTYTGKRAEIQLVYDSKDEAERDCEKINKINPSGYYGVCTVKED